MPEALSRGARISFDDQGWEEPSLLLLLGCCGSDRVFDELPQRCAAPRRALALDWRGHGQSERSAEDFGTEELIDDALALTQARSVHPVVPVSLLRAGWVAIELSRSLGLRVAKLVLLDWIVLHAPTACVGAARALEDPAQCEQRLRPSACTEVLGERVP